MNLIHRHMDFVYSFSMSRLNPRVVIECFKNNGVLGFGFRHFLFCFREFLPTAAIYIIFSMYAKLFIQVQI